ncbi:MAG: peptidase C1 [Bacteroidetes bacterium]|nr:MAG: peptidase C1 [Bacteroidota bacterium]
MSKHIPPHLDGFVLSATDDLPDERDLLYRARPIPLKEVMNVPEKLLILDQGNEGACTGFALAATINRLNELRDKNISVSARMLYEMARKHDEWPGEEYTGSSCRGAIKGFFNMGVCQDELWPYENNKPGELSVEIAKDARSNTIGAYYRLSRRIADFHAAINEAGVIFCSARVHSGWSREKILDHRITLSTEKTGGHAFAIVGYNQEGFWIQNSWGRSWGNKGIALWSYEDWQENLIDAWVLSLAIATPKVSNGTAVLTQKMRGEGEISCLKPPRHEVAGHFVHIDDGNFHDAGNYWSNLGDVETTARRIANNDQYKHILFYAHGGLNSPEDSASRILAMRDVFKDNGIYPFHFMYDTGIVEELKDVIISRGNRISERATGFSDLWDRLLERLSRRVGRALWREMKYGARQGFKGDYAGTETLGAFQDVLSGKNALKIHLVGHSTGGILMASLLKSLREIDPNICIETCSLMAPAATVELFKNDYLPYLSGQQKTPQINDMAVYNLTDKLEQDDSVGPYRKSLLYFVSRSFEENTPASLIGMQIESNKIEQKRISNLQFIYSHGDQNIEPRSLSTTHGGFDNDPATMNDILRRILDSEPTRKFLHSDLC